MPRQDVTITTKDGVCPAYFFTPSTGAGPWPGVIFFMDGLGIRPAMWEMGQKLADAGYAVLLPDAYYRFGPYPPMDPPAIFANPDKRAKLMEWVTSLTRERKVTDAGAYIEYLATRPEVKGQKYGATGYCMGGHAALTAAGAFPDKLAAIASFHGGGLGADSPDSPHQFASKITARVYVAAAIEDPSFPADQEARLEAALSAAKVDHLLETYEGAHHGFAVRDLPVYNAAATERHWNALLKLFSETLG
jgi:carboxymethylenebutenolidase